MTTLTEMSIESYSITSSSSSSLCLPIGYQLPKLPTNSLSSFGLSLQSSIDYEIIQMQEESITSDELRDMIFRQTRTVFKNTTQILFLIKTGRGIDDNSMKFFDENKTIIKSLLIATESDVLSREGRLNHAIERFTEVRLLKHFFENGTLCGPDLLDNPDDENFIGAMLGFAQELSRYVIGRACDNDVNSIYLCKAIVSQIQGKMLEFDLRNGNLRRKYDGLKYVVKSIETVLYELSLLDDDTNDGSTNPKKKPRTTDNYENLILIPMSDIDGIKERMDIYDKLREDVIKTSRDVQKLSKQAIFSVHRGNLEDCKNKIDQARVIAKGILEKIAPHPTLRQGAVSNSLEEWAEALLTLVWVENKRICLKGEMEIVNSNEYIGALSDFTGEIGRIAVSLASTRVIEPIKSILEADLTISSSLMILNINGKYTKKVEAVNNNLKKIEDIVYELSLLLRGGRAPKPKDEMPSAEDKTDNE